MAPTEQPCCDARTCCYCCCWLRLRCCCCVPTVMAAPCLSGAGCQSVCCRTARCKQGPCQDQATTRHPTAKSWPLPWQASVSMGPHTPQVGHHGLRGGPSKHDLQLSTRRRARTQSPLGCLIHKRPHMHTCCFDQSFGCALLCSCAWHPLTCATTQVAAVLRCRPGV